MADTIVWISGCTEGLGSGLVTTVPWPGARIINMSRRIHPDFETVQFDLTRPETYQAVEDSFRKELAGFKGKRAIFVHNAFYAGPGNFGFVSEVDQADYARCVLANAAAPLILGDMFLRAVNNDYEAGLVLMSSAAARHPFVGGASYNAAKAGVEMWVRTVKRELAERKRNAWVVAVRPGFVDSYSTRFSTTFSEETYPAGPMMAKLMEEGGHAMTPEQAASDIWAALPPKNDESVMLFGKMVESR
jgi:benzil reductase ((S)-benzoin forming)